MYTKAPTLPALVAPLPLAQPMPPQQLLPLPRRPACGALRADHQLLRRHCRTQPHLGAGCSSPPVAQVMPIKRPAPAPDAADASALVSPRSPKMARKIGGGNAHLPATNPFYRRRSRDQPMPTPPPPPPPLATLPSAAPLASPATSRLFAVANVAIPQMPQMQLEATLLSTPKLLLQQQSFSLRRDAQTSPTLPSPGTSTLLSTPTATRSGHTPVSLSSWVRSAKCRLAARIRRSLSAPRVHDTSANAAAPTPKRLGGVSECGGSVGSEKQQRKRRHASLQRLVHRLTASPFSTTTMTSAEVVVSSPTLSPASSPSGGAQTGRILQLLPDGSRTVRLRRPRGAKFGFFVSRQQDGVYLTRFNDPGTQLRYRSVISVGDQLLEIEGLSTASMELADMHRFISDRRSLVLRVRSPYGSAF